MIIGAGPAGTAAGFDLACAGYSVLILDRRDFPRTKACAGGITPKALNLFAYDISHLVERQCRRVRVRRPSGQTFTVEETQPLCHMVQRRDLDLFSLKKVMASGADFQKITKIKGLDQRSDHVRVVTDDGRYTARYLIGADGANSRIRQMAVLPRRRYPVHKYPALEADVPVERADLISMEFDFSMGIPGYYWIFPKKDHVSIGIYGANHSVPMSADMLQDYAQLRFKTRDIRNVKGYPICVGDGGWLRRAPGINRVLLAGDAAGLAEPLLGEGIFFALKSGRTAAAAIMGASKGHGNALKRYRAALTRTYLDLMLYGFSAKMLYRFSEPCLKLAAYRGIHGYFSKGYAKGDPISHLFFPF
mgnify:CR=1 FL=1